MIQFPKLIHRQVLIDPIYDPDKIGSIFMPPAAQNIAPSRGLVVAVGPELADEIQPGVQVLVSYREWDTKRCWYDETGHQYFFYWSHEVVGFVNNAAEVSARRGDVVVRPIWPASGPVQHGELFTIDRVFEVPKSPQTATVVSTGEGVTLVSIGDTVAIPSTGGYELGVKDRVLYVMKETDILGILHAVENDSSKSDSTRRKTKTGPRRHQRSG